MQEYAELATELTARIQFQMEQLKRETQAQNPTGVRACTLKTVFRGLTLANANHLLVTNPLKPLTTQKIPLKHPASICFYSS
jgi:hypothetical protein